MGCPKHGNNVRLFIGANGGSVAPGLLGHQFEVLVADLISELHGGASPIDRVCD